MKRDEELEWTYDHEVNLYRLSCYHHKGEKGIKIRNAILNKLEVLDLLLAEWENGGD